MKRSIRTKILSSMAMRRQWITMLEQRSREVKAGDYVTQEELDNELRATRRDEPTKGGGPL